MTSEIHPILPSVSIASREPAEVSSPIQRPSRRHCYLASMAILMAGSLAVTGCSVTSQWWGNGFKVGPDYCSPPVSVAETWIDAGDPGVSNAAADYSYWWTVFNDPVLDNLVNTACDQNLTLQKAGLRILEARAQRGIAAGSLFPQQQQMTGDYSRNKFSDNSYPFGEFPGNREFSNWSVGFDAAWELDIWGRIRRGIEAADANLDAQVEDYDAVLVMLQGDVAAAYIQMRTLEERLVLVRKNIDLQNEALALIEKRFQGGIVSEIDVRQAKATLEVTRSLIPTLQENHRKVQNSLCILLGIPPRDLQAELGDPQPIPSAVAQVVAGIPADLLRRRPDVRRAERFAAAQSARIGIAAADFYPRIGINGKIALEAEEFGDIFRGDSLAGGVGPGFQWNILNYGRIANRVRIEDARFQQSVLDYQNAVLMANKEVEDAMVSFLREQQRVKSLEQAVYEIEEALRISFQLYEQGVLDYQRVLDSQRSLVQQQDTLAESRGKIALNLVAVYKALGGGWSTRLAPQTPVCEVTDASSADEPVPDDDLPNPAEETLTPTAPTPRN